MLDWLAGLISCKTILPQRRIWALPSRQWPNSRAPSSDGDPMKRQQLDTFPSWSACSSTEKAWAVVAGYGICEDRHFSLSSQRRIRYVTSSLRAYSHARLSTSVTKAVFQGCRSSSSIMCYALLRSGGRFDARSAAKSRRLNPNVDHADPRYLVPAKIGVVA